MNEDFDMDRLFDPASNEGLVKKAKRKSTIRMVLTSSFALICGVILIILLNLLLMPYYMDKKMLEQELYYDLTGANTFIGNWQAENKLIGSSANAPVYKLIGERPVFVADASLSSAERNRKLQPFEGSNYTYTGERMMKFYHPSMTYEEYPNDLELLDEVDENQWIEIALSFDQLYDMDSVREMLPSDVNWQWSWVDTWSKEEKELLANEVIEPTNEFQAIGFTMQNESGERITQPDAMFIENLQLAMKKGGPYKQQFKEIYESIAREKENVSVQQLALAGVVVTGTKEQLANLLNQPTIKASSFGVIVDEY